MAKRKTASKKNVVGRRYGDATADAQAKRRRKVTKCGTRCSTDSPVVRGGPLWGTYYSDCLHRCDVSDGEYDPSTWGPALPPRPSRSSAAAAAVYEQAPALPPRPVTKKRAAKPVPVSPLIRQRVEELAELLEQRSATGPRLTRGTAYAPVPEGAGKWNVMEAIKQKAAELGVSAADVVKSFHQRAAAEIEKQRAYLAEMDKYGRRRGSRSRVARSSRRRGTDGG